MHGGVFLSPEFRNDFAITATSHRMETSKAEVSDETVAHDMALLWNLHRYVVAHVAYASS
jgi:hypothetical protein